MTRRVSPDAMVAHLEGEAVILNIRTKEYFKLNATAQSVWRGLERGASDSDIVADLLKEYEVDEPTATTEVQRILGEMSRAKLLA